MTRALVLLTAVMWAGLVAAQPFNPRDHGRGDLAYLQAVLTIEGFYNGLLDGDWGRRSQSALDGFAFATDKTLRPDATHLAHLIRRFEDERALAGWSRIRNAAAGISVAQPVLLMDETDRDQPHLTYATPSRDLLVRWIADGGDATGAMHDWARNAHAGREEAYVHATADRLITAVELENQRRVYLRSWLSGGVFVTLLIQSEPRQYNRAALIAASIAPGPAPEIELAPGGPLAALVVAPPKVARAPDALPRKPHAPVAVTPEPAFEAPRRTLAKGSGTGFFVNATDVVTAAHVIEGCDALALEDGTPLSVIAVEPEPDLAVLQAGTRSAHWLPLRAGDALLLGQGVAAVGYPFLSLTDGALSLTMGNVSALSAGDHRPDWVVISAPVQPGNSGGPLLSDRGEVVGVVVARASDGFYLKETGTLPQNINYAVKLSRLRAFLDGAGVALPRGADDPAPLSDGLSETKQAAIRPVMCY